MEILKFLILLCCAYHGLASHESYTIPVEHYDTELQNLGEHVEIPETPVKVIKITKTVAVKVPVPYPVKVIEKVPYPVHINKPYPVPVPHIVKVPHGESPEPLPKHEALNSKDGQQHPAPQEDYDGIYHEFYNGVNSNPSKFVHYSDYSAEITPRYPKDTPSDSYYGYVAANGADAHIPQKYDDFEHFPGTGNADHGQQNFH